MFDVYTVVQQQRVIGVYAPTVCMHTLYNILGVGFLFRTNEIFLDLIVHTLIVPNAVTNTGEIFLKKIPLRFGSFGNYDEKKKIHFRPVIEWP